MDFTKEGKKVSLSRLLIILLNLAGIFFAFSSGVVDSLLGYYAWHWDAQRCYEFLMLAVPVVNILYLWFTRNESSLIGLWLKRKRLEEQLKLNELEIKRK